MLQSGAAQRKLKPTKNSISKLLTFLPAVAVAEPYELINQLMPTTKSVHITFINNDFAQAAASFVNQAAPVADFPVLKNSMRLYTTDDTFKAEDVLWQGEP